MVEKNGIDWFDRVTKIRFGGVTDSRNLNLGKFSNLEMVKSDHWPTTGELTDVKSWVSVTSNPVTQQVNETFSKCQLKLVNIPGDLGVSIQIDQSFSCSTLPADDSHKTGRE